jgi:hypothetical protein
VNHIAGTFKNIFFTSIGILIMLKTIKQLFNKDVPFETEKSVAPTPMNAEELEQVSGGRWVNGARGCNPFNPYSRPCEIWVY